MDNPLHAICQHQRLDGIGIGDIHFFKAEAIQRVEIVEPCGLQRRVIIIVEIIKPDHRFTAFDQPRRNGMADKPGGTGNKYWIIRHFAHLLFRSPVWLPAALA